MAGELHTRKGSPLPHIGTPVVIAVNTANNPTGIWLGTIREIGEPYEPSTEKRLRNVMTYRCNAIIHDPAAPKDRDGKEPDVNYTVYTVELSPYMLLEAYRAAERLNADLRVQLKFEQGFRGEMLRAIANPAPVNALEEALRRARTRV